MSYCDSTVQLQGGCLSSRLISPRVLKELEELVMYNQHSFLYSQVVVNYPPISFMLREHHWVL